MVEEKGFKHKLNMLDPGTRMLKWIGILTLIGLLLSVSQFRMAAFCVWVVSGIIVAVLLIMLAIKAHQDNVMNEMALKENTKTEKTDCQPETIQFMGTVPKKTSQIRCGLTGLLCMLWKR